jgi:hypothetical protein
MLIPFIDLKNRGDWQGELAKLHEKLNIQVAGTREDFARLAAKIEVEGGYQPAVAFNDRVTFHFNRYTEKDFSMAFFDPATKIIYNNKELLQKSPANFGFFMIHETLEALHSRAARKAGADINIFGSHVGKDVIRDEAILMRGLNSDFFKLSKDFRAREATIQKSRRKGLRKYFGKAAAYSSETEKIYKDVEAIFNKQAAPSISKKAKESFRKSSEQMVGMPIQAAFKAGSGHTGFQSTKRA